MATERTYETEITFTARRYEGDARRGAGTSFDFAPNCYVTLFDDGRWRVVVREQDGYQIHHVEDMADNPGGHMLETKAKK